jgi:hypothetical protein
MHKGLRVSVPVPELPTKRLPELVQDEPGPVTVTVLVEPELRPIKPKTLLTAPPFLPGFISRIHGRLRQRGTIDLLPTSRLWEIGDIVDVLEAWEPA